MKESKINQLLKEAEKHINYFARLYYIPGMEPEDVKQILRMKLFLRYKKYNKKYSINTFIGSIFKREMYRLMKISTRQRKKDAEMGKYLDAHNLIGEEAVSEYGYDGFDIMINSVIHNIKSTNKERAIKVFKWFLEGRTSKEISWLLKKSNAKVNKIKVKEILPAVEMTLGFKVI
ncbi:hypothetical protein KY343_07300 [Candidatus Woesearchaeota archaeon]|nr:hypothetical protein [Candidatus Woesearchaeota archaeon]